jgi:hypothetical protein
MISGVTWDSTCSLRFIYKDSCTLLEKYQEKYSILVSKDLDKRIQGEIKYIKRIIDFHKRRIYESKAELILRGDRIFLREHLLK